MRDELNKGNRMKQNECLILNLDHSSNSGTHWTCLFVKDGSTIYFDSYGHPPPFEVEQYCNYESLYSTSDKIQQRNQIMCGHYCIYMLYKLSHGSGFNNILKELYLYNNER